MYRVAYVNKYYRQFNDDYVFESFKDAKQYLIDKGFVEDARMFRSCDLNAYIMLLKIYKKEVDY